MPSISGIVALPSSNQGSASRIGSMNIVTNPNTDGRMRNATIASGVERRSRPNAVPWRTTRSSVRSVPASTPPSTSHPAVSPRTAAAPRRTTAATATATTRRTAVVVRAAAILPATTRPRRGSSANVTARVRCENSDVTARIARIGMNIASPMLAEPLTRSPNVSPVSPGQIAMTTDMPTTARAMRPRKTAPARVLTTLRFSALQTRRNGTGAWASRALIGGSPWWTWRGRAG